MNDNSIYLDTVKRLAFGTVFVLMLAGCTKLVLTLGDWMSSL